MAALMGRLLRACGARALDRDGACRITAACLKATQPRALIGSLHAPGAAGARRYSSESKDELRVRYLHGEDAGESRTEVTLVYTSLTRGGLKT